MIFFNWDTFLSTVYKKLQKIKVYQSFTSSDGIGDGIVYCKASNNPNCVEYNDALNLPLTPAAKDEAMALQPEALYTEQPGLKPIKEVGLFENYGPVIPVQHHEETCPYPSLESWIIVKKLYPIGTLIKKEFDGTMYVGEVTDIEPQKRIYTIYYKDDNTTKEMSIKQINTYLHKDEIKKYPICTKIAKKFNSL